ncbi:RNA-directed DNA polymerase from mobile element jockey-like protein [Willisornis vidua]|uniref:RNA-directed DNA polymerase from mobile element jockey-like protein n=1 Tax=Willisornis vidua TaxID=1566151 RepID=A0ABQ9DLJ5_9PASS|nr:RNA-directed DNA polymerase from mobile element jockey-like protein [Willisornis vidua]
MKRKNSTFTPVQMHSFLKTQLQDALSSESLYAKVHSIDILVPCIIPTTQITKKINFGVRTTPPTNHSSANVAPVFKKGKQQDFRNYRPVSLTSVPGKVMEKIILASIEKHLKDNAVIDHSFVRGKSCLSNLISFYDKATHVVDQEKTLDVIFLDFTKALNTVSRRILLNKVSSTQLDKHIMWWLSNWLTSQA